MSNNKQSLSQEFYQVHLMVGMVPISIITIWWGALIGYYSALITDVVFKLGILLIFVLEYRRRFDALSYLRVSVFRNLLFVSMPLFWQIINPYPDNLIWLLFALVVLALEVCIVLLIENRHWEETLSQWAAIGKINLHTHHFRIRRDFFVRKASQNKWIPFAFIISPLIVIVIGRIIGPMTDFFPLRIVALGVMMILGYVLAKSVAWTLNLYWYEKETGIKLRTEFAVRLEDVYRGG